MASSQASTSLSGAAASVSSSSTPAGRSRVPSMPRLLYGTAWKGDFTSDLVILALSHGFRGIDTAAQRKHYREDHVGAALDTAQTDLQLDRRDVWVQTKFTPRSGQDWTQPSTIPFGHDEPVAVQVRKSFAASLRNLHPWLDFEPFEEVARKITANSERGVELDAGVEYGDKHGEAYVDSYVLHSPLTTLDRTLNVWAAMESFVQLGLVRQIGVSNVYDAEIFQALSRTTRIAPSIVQNRWHYTTGHDVALLSILSPALAPNECGEPVVYQPFWSITGNPNLLASPAVQESAELLGWTPQQVVYAFLARGMDIPRLTITVLSGTKDEQHMHEAVHAVNNADDPRWTQSHVDAIRKFVYGE
ncbi:hypothetical protein PANT_25c00011 [Moesziomyces antarcticus T-34]|uniref:NADP-dependent oxidoreductase domain-containing protein n=2 Tax=Ustilaginaceae TaxID=5268 RepID=M9LSV1_PSEA3|nr:hypothetical protein PANT_25c00011 [Moesziomyces antarcticus T-34]